MGRILPFCEKVEVKKGPWTPEEDKKLLAYVQKHGHGNWRSVPAKAGLQRCGKSCRLRWINYLKPDIKRGNFTSDEDRTIIQLHALVGNRWSIIAAHLPRRTDNEIKNYWNTNIKKRLIRMGLDPITHKPVKSNSFQAYGGGYDQFKDTVHLAQWESVRINAEARESMLQVGTGSSHVPRLILSKIPTNKPCYSSHSLPTQHNAVYNMYALVLATNHDLPEGCFPASTLRIPDGEAPVFSTNVQQFTDDNIIQTSNQTKKVMDDYVSNLQDDDIMVAVEAFTTARFESIQDAFNGYSSMEGLIN